MADGTVYRAGGAVNLTAQGNVALGRVEAGTNPITVIATTGAISDNTAAEGAGNENLVGGDLNLLAASGVGAPGGSTDIDTAATRIDTATGSGGIYLAETDAVQLGNTGPITTGSGGGAIAVTAGGTMTLAQAVTTAGSGSISLTTTAGDLQVGQAVSAGGGLSLDAAGLLHITAAVSGSRVELAGGTGITHTAAGDVTSGSTITATATTGDIDMADGARYQAAGDATLTAQGNVGLGHIDAGGNTLTVTATAGAISDNTAAEGAGNENLVAGNLSLTVGTGIGAPGAAANIDTAADKINAQTTRSGDIYLAETDAVTLGSTTGISSAAGADIAIKSGGEMTVGAGGVQAFASGDVRLTATAGDLAIGGEVATDSGDLELTAGRSIRQAEGRLLRTRNDNQGTLALRSGQAIGTADAPILTDVAVLAAEATGGGVFATQVDGTQGNLAPFCMY